MHIFDYITIGIALALAVSLIAAYAFGSFPCPRERPVLPGRREAAGGHSGFEAVWNVHIGVTIC